jgi:Kef-type K+ transport system membrane component KefB
MVGLALAGIFAHQRDTIRRLRTTVFALLTPFYFLNAGMKVSLPAVWAFLGTIVVLLLVKLIAKIIGVWPLTRVFGLSVRDSNYTTLLMSTGLTFGTISALFGLNKGYIDQDQYSVLVTVIIASAVVPTMLAQAFFKPDIAPGRQTEVRNQVSAAPSQESGMARLNLRPFTPNR